MFVVVRLNCCIVLLCGWFVGLCGCVVVWLCCCVVVLVCCCVAVLACSAVVLLCCCVVPLLCCCVVVLLCSFVVCLLLKFTVRDSSPMVCRIGCCCCCCVANILCTDAVLSSPCPLALLLADILTRVDHSPEGCSVPILNSARHRSLDVIELSDLACQRGPMDSHIELSSLASSLHSGPSMLDMRQWEKSSGDYPEKRSIQVNPAYTANCVQSTFFATLQKLDRLGSTREYL